MIIHRPPFPIFDLIVPLLHRRPALPLPPRQVWKAPSHVPQHIRHRQSIDREWRGAVGRGHGRVQELREAALHLPLLALQERRVHLFFFLNAEYIRNMECSISYLEGGVTRRTVS